MTGLKSESRYPDDLLEEIRELFTDPKASHSREALEGVADILSEFSQVLVECPRDSGSRLDYP